ncbi:S41 family peptidase [Adhaeribacter swui]|uniref:S41 family peptidase n=1 Tax=Adhaeribacter swui TaxID=2086471 RepID=A0A7G7G9U0_9BACT|nr:S41 family peptidase [Adhaeribacter swui]QNF33924.1 S41 family peptidase [Adhaeribacter swui]
MKKIFSVLAMLLVLATTACEKENYAPTSDALINFDYLWQEFDQRYGNFEVKNINWPALRDKYRPQLNTTSTNADLHRVLEQLINELDDNHVTIAPTDGKLKYLVSDATHQLNHIPTLELIKSKYLTEAKIATPEITYGLLPGNIGYIDITLFDDKFKNYEPNLDQIIDYLRDTKGLVLDIRNHQGGRDEVAQYVAGRFASSPALYMKARKRNGPQHTEFTDWYEWQVKPTGKSQYRKPIVILTSDFTISAAETFLLAMKRLPQVKQVGTTTSGDFSDRATLEMPNGWQFTLSIGDYRDHNGVSWEGKGLKPDVEIQNTPQDIEANKDLMLEKAIDLLQ